MNQRTITYRAAATPSEFAQGRKLFELYAQSLGFDLSFQGFAGELDALAEQYGPPAGALHLAFSGEQAIGCAGIRAFDEATAELKRMFVLPEYQGRQVGQRLLERCIASAIEGGYRRLVLDTLPHMEGALRLYRRAGFEEIPPYRYNPFADAVFLEKKLRE
ncbi:GNAT family N-acetyltransferase [Paraflavisolibacter sp. H34]|uniref:GNAT family N-acetyltransferase n=1 Tax=Huijunlia imazamoxiresistens TaxID=3127457 RepID=UPI003019C6A3